MTNKKNFEERLQEIRNPASANKIRYRRRVQDEQEAERYFKEALLEKLKQSEEDDGDTFPNLPSWP